MKRRFIAIILSAVMTMGLFTGCGEAAATANNDAASQAEADTEETGTDEEQAIEEQAETAESSEEESAPLELAGVEITFLNSKGEIQEAIENMAAAFEAETGISIEVQICATGESPYTKVTSAYNSGTAPTMSMLDITDVVTLAKEYALDLSNETWVEECSDQATRVDGSVYGFPFCIEGRGIIYNKKAIEDTLNREFDPKSVVGMDSLKALLDELRAAGMENPVVISKEDWSLGNHQLGLVYDAQDGTNEGSSSFIAQLKDGSASMADNERFNQFVDTFDMLKEYNINKADPLGALYEQDPIFLVDEEAAFWLNGCWAWPNLAEAGANTADDYGFISLPFGNDAGDFANTAIEAAATKAVMIDKVQATKEQQEAAKAFINWMVYNENGQRMLVEECGAIPACANNAFTALDPLGKNIQDRMKNGETFPSAFVAPGDHWSVLGASMQKYLAGESTKEELAADIDNYWSSLE